MATRCVHEECHETIRVPYGRQGYYALLREAGWSATPAGWQCHLCTEVHATPLVQAHAVDRETGQALTLADLWRWLEAMTSEYGQDLPLYVQAGSAPCQGLRNAWVQRAPEGHRVIVLSALPTAPQQKEG